MACCALPAQDQAETGGLQKLLREERLTGDWGGLRSDLEDQGLTFEFYYTADVLSNVSGGRRRATEALGNVDLLLTTDLERLFDWKGGTIFLYGLGNHGGDPSDNVGDLQIVDNIETFDTWKLYEAWFQQTFYDERLSLLVGLYDLNSEFDVIPTADLFLSSSHGVGAELGASGLNGPSIFSTTSLGARLEVLPLESLYLRAVVLDGVPGDPDDPRGTEVILREDDGLLLASEIGFVNNPKAEVRPDRGARHQYEPPVTDDGLRRGYFGKYALGVWGYTTEFDDFVRTDPSGDPVKRHGTYGAYILGEQGVYYEEDDPAQGLSLFARLGLADDRVNPVDGYVGGGMVYRGLFPGRDRDRVGFAVAAAHLGKEFRRSLSQAGQETESWEIALELTYRARLTSWLSIQPDFHYVINPGGSAELDDAVVVGARMELAF